ncbi:MAG: dTDP-4-dehydrorhamnose reductase [Candidatus Cohnella colombiensis]|uniref:dTDP-4-dehydrorhamnose reductase n=1 Tax=Candidatus Cohnella colombiensis TaxID=3121368 RepID=A0AA95JF65_9BACL|nr:MAG: dTDP-4-dehydrorhamnose reductase [Cohnella sp.]
MNKPLVVAITGASGQLGRELALMKREGVKLIGLDRAALDITNAEQCVAAIAELRPDVIIHAAAFTAVDQAEAEPDVAWLVNVEGTRNIAAAAEAIGAKLVYVSTDYVFRGDGTTPYEVDADTDPQTVYGRTKLEGERMAVAVCSRSFIVRTSWVFGAYGNNFVYTMLKLAEQKRELSVVNDQVGSPTYTADLAEFLVALANTELYGTYHASNSGVCSWFDFAKAVFEEAEVQGVTVNSCTTAQFPRPAPRPSYSVLSSEALVAAGFKPLRPWGEALRELLQSFPSGNNY